MTARLIISLSKYNEDLITKIRNRKTIFIHVNVTYHLRCILVVTIKE